MTFVPENLRQNVTIVVMGSLTWIRRLMYPVGFPQPKPSPVVAQDRFNSVREIEGLRVNSTPSPVRATSIRCVPRSLAPVTRYTTR